MRQYATVTIPLIAAKTPFRLHSYLLPRIHSKLQTVTSTLPSSRTNTFYDMHNIRIQYLHSSCQFHIETTHSIRQTRKSMNFSYIYIKLHVFILSIRKREICASRCMRRGYLKMKNWQRNAHNNDNNKKMDAVRYAIRDSLKFLCDMKKVR